MSGAARIGRLPLTYDESRATFRHAAGEAGVASEPHPISALGPDGQRLHVDVTRWGATRAKQVMIVMAGVHGVEGFVCSALLSELLDRWRALPADLAVVQVHAVNPWGMAWGRRQNESNVDLNRNWRRDDGVPFDNQPYEELHPLACPDVPELPEGDEILATAERLVAERGLAWVRDGITMGQYQHPDGLHYGGRRTEESNRILERVVPNAIKGAERLLIVDLHTGHGPRATVTALSDQPPGSAQDDFLRTWCDRVEATVDNPSATTGRKAGQIANGLRALCPDAESYSTSLEMGTVGDLEQLVATYQEQWVHRNGTRADPAHRAAIWRYRCCFTPDDAEWERAAFAGGLEHLDRALVAFADGT